MTTHDQPEPTRRAVIDPLRRCPCSCKFCYYRHKGETWIKPFAEVQRDIDAAAARDNDRLDVTGGEPLVYPDLVELVAYARQAHGMDCRVITSCIGDRAQLDRLLARGSEAPDWLISMHGLAETHNLLVGVHHARARQIAAIGQILRSGRPSFSVNFVLVRQNQDEIAAFAQWLAQFRPRVVNFINFNLHHQEWRASPLALDLVADFRQVLPQWPEAIGVLEEAGAGVNLRYYPMCLVAPEFRRCVSNDLHVGFDTGEWDYDLQPKTFARFREWSCQLSAATEEKGPPCDRCELQWVCGGGNRYWHRAAIQRYGEILLAQTGTGVPPNDFYHYRHNNVAGFA